MTLPEEPQELQPQNELLEEDSPTHVICPISMKFITRVSKLPVVEETLKVTTGVYGRVKVITFPVNNIKANFIFAM
jgi:hypothetical protein